MGDDICWSHEEFLGMDAQCTRPRWHQGVHASYQPGTPMWAPVAAWYYDPRVGIVHTTKLMSLYPQDWEPR